MVKSLYSSGVAIFSSVSVGTGRSETGSSNLFVRILGSNEAIIEDEEMDIEEAGDGGSSDAEGEDLPEVFGVTIRPRTEHGTTDPVEDPLASDQDRDIPLEGDPVR